MTKLSKEFEEFDREDARVARQFPIVVGLGYGAAALLGVALFFQAIS